MTKEEVAQKILKTLESQRFADWYGPGPKGKFDMFIMGEYPKEDPRQPTKEDILGEIVKLFHL